MLNLLWIIGNGYDRNLGLATDYRSFLKNRYFKDGVQNKYRDELVKRVVDSVQNGRLNFGVIWKIF